ncbi:MAG: hypothetical protein WAX14_04680 [Rhodococcus sp. (in: high G+C Gram-positive bacteria)]|uniref:hypothetical protein n=1 Tax=Rhodococcus sp. TaxID=1831 RepID=UPI003BB73147
MESALQFSPTLTIGAIVVSFAFAITGDRFGTRRTALPASLLAAGAIAATAAGPATMIAPTSSVA